MIGITADAQSGVSGGWWGQAGRARRMAVLLIGIVTLSALDLAMTLQQLTTIGMHEMNPIAAVLVRMTGSTWPLVVLKIVTAGACVLVLFRLRAHLPSEVAAWVCLVILLSMSGLWVYYGFLASGLDPVGLELLTLNDDNWLRVDVGGHVR
ncbi:MAG: DUF5658 family protein [Planctomycetota bacterium]